MKLIAYCYIIGLAAAGAYGVSSEYLIGLPMYLLASALILLFFLAKEILNETTTEK